MKVLIFTCLLIALANAQTDMSKIRRLLLVPDNFYSNDPSKAPSTMEPSGPPTIVEVANCCNDWNSTCYTTDNEHNNYHGCRFCTNDPCSAACQGADGESDSIECKHCCRTAEHQIPWNCRTEEPSRTPSKAPTSWPTFSAPSQIPTEKCKLNERETECNEYGVGKCCSLEKCFPDEAFGFYEMCKSNATCAWHYPNECQEAAKWTCDSSAMFVEDTTGSCSEKVAGDTCGSKECWYMNPGGSDPQMKCGSCISEGWGAWSAWTECSEPCGDVIGQKVRIRTNSKGHGDHTESVPCSVAALCPTVSWSTVVLELPGESVSSKELELQIAFADTLGVSEESVSLTFTEGDMVTLTFATTDTSMTEEHFVLLEASVASAVSNAYYGHGGH